MHTRVRKALQQHRDFLTESTNRLRQRVIYIWMLFLFLQTPCPNSRCGTCCVQAGWWGLKPAVGCGSGCPWPRGADYDILSPFIAPFISLLASLKTCAVSGESAVSSSQSRRTSGRLVSIAALLSHVLEALGVWGRLLGCMPLLDAFHGRSRRSKRYLPGVTLVTLSA